jgi:hypothetical protein
MVDNLIGDGDGTTDCGVAGGDEERTSPEPRMVRLAATTPTEVRKGT